MKKRNLHADETGRNESIEFMQLLADMALELAVLDDTDDAYMRETIDALLLM